MDEVRVCWGWGSRWIGCTFLREKPMVCVKGLKYKSKSILFNVNASTVHLTNSSALLCVCPSHPNQFACEPHRLGRLHKVMALPPSNATFNMTLYMQPWLCTTDTCPIEWASIHYVPSLAGNAFYLALFICLLLAQIYLGVRHRSWSFMIALLGGEILEIIGYVARIRLHYNIFIYDSFLM